MTFWNIAGWVLAVALVLWVFYRTWREEGWKGVFTFGLVFTAGWVLAALFGTWVTVAFVGGVFIGYTVGFWRGLRDHLRYPSWMRGIEVKSDYRTSQGRKLDTPAQSRHSHHYDPKRDGPPSLS